MNVLSQITGASDFSSETQQRMIGMYNFVTEHHGMIQGLACLMQWVQKIEMIRAGYKKYEDDMQRYNTWVKIAYDFWDSLTSDEADRAVERFDAWIEQQYRLWTSLVRYKHCVTTFNSWMMLNSQIKSCLNNNKNALDNYFTCFEIQYGMSQQLLAYRSRYMCRWIKAMCRSWRDSATYHQYYQWLCNTWHKWNAFCKENESTAGHVFSAYIKNRALIGAATTPQLIQS